MQAARTQVVPLHLTPFSPPSTKPVDGAAGVGLWEVQQCRLLCLKEGGWGGGLPSQLGVSPTFTAFDWLGMSSCGFHIPETQHWPSGGSELGVE